MAAYHWPSSRHFAEIASRTLKAEEEDGGGAGERLAGTGGEVGVEWKPLETGGGGGMLPPAPRGGGGGIPPAEGAGAGLLGSFLVEVRLMRVCAGLSPLE